MDFAQFVSSTQCTSAGQARRHQYETIVNQTAGVKVHQTRHLRQRPKTHQTSPKNPQSPQSIQFNGNVLHRAATNGDLPTLHAIRFGNDGADINCCDQFGWSALMMASCAGHLTSVAFLLQQQCVDVSIVDAQQRSALSLAADQKHTDVVQLLHTHLQRLNEPRHSNDNHQQDVVVLSSDDEDRPPVADAVFFCADCQRSFASTTRTQHVASILHRFNIRDQLPALSKRYHLPDSNRGFRLMLKQGWNRECGLGPAQRNAESLSFPLKTTLRTARSGLGVRQPPARITHFQPHDVNAVQRRDRRVKVPPLPVAVQTKRKLLEEGARARRRDRRLRDALS